MTSRPRTHRRGMTLFQLLVALALAVVLLAAVFLFLHDLVDSRERAVERSRREDAVAALFERLESDLALAIAGEPSVGAGVAGDATALTVLTRGVQPSVDAPRTGLLDLRRHEYRHDVDAQALIGTRGLARGGATETIVFDGRIASLRFRYYDGHEWLDAFDSRAAGGLPAAVEVAVWFDLPTDTMTELAAVDDAGTFLEESMSPDADESTAPARSAMADSESVGSPPLPPPDRVRVISIPDGGVPASGATGDSPSDLPRKPPNESPNESPNEPPIGPADQSDTEARAPDASGAAVCGIIIALGPPLAWRQSPNPGRRARGRRHSTRGASVSPALRARSFLLLAVLLVLAMAFAVVAGMVMLARGDAAIAVTHEQAAQSRALAWSGVQAVGVTLDDQRQRVLAGERPTVERQLVIYETSSALGVVRLLPVGIDSRGDASWLRAEGGLVDLNRADVTALTASGMVDTAQAGAIVAARTVAGGRFLSESDLAGVTDLSPEKLFGSLEALAWAADAGRPFGRSMGGDRARGDEAETTSSAESFGVRAAANGLLDVVTVFAVEPLVRRDGRERISLAGGWSDDIAAALESDVGAETTKAIEALLKSGVPASDAALVKLLRQREASVAEWREVLDAVTVHPAPWIGGRVDLNSAPYEAILATPSITPQQAAEIVRQREDLDADERAAPTWLLTRGIVQGDQFEALVDRVTTRCFQWRVRLAAGEVSSADPDGPLRNAVVWEVVIDLSAPRWRVAYLRDATLLPLAAALISAEPEELEFESGAETSAPDAEAKGEPMVDDASESDEEVTEAEAPPDESMSEPEKPGITAPTRRWSGGERPAADSKQKAAPAQQAPAHPSGPAPVGRWRTS